MKAHRVLSWAYAIGWGFQVASTMRVNSTRAWVSPATAALAGSDPPRHGTTRVIGARAPTTALDSVRLELSNTLNATVHVYVVAQDLAGATMVLTPAGAWRHPAAQSPGCAITSQVEAFAIQVDAASTVPVALPGPFVSGRVYFAAGELQFLTDLAAGGAGGGTLHGPSRCSS